ncbi:MAG: hypothetical protein ACFFB5_24755 [Promethearchaeota archaeon]
MSEYKYTYFFYNLGDSDEWRAYFLSKYSYGEKSPKEEYDSNTNFYSMEKEIEPYEKSFVFNGDKYFPVRTHPIHFPVITGFPKIVVELMRPYGRRAFFSGEKYMDYVFAPQSCELRRIVNYPLTKMGGPQISIVGTYGTGKSNFMNLVCALYLTKTNMHNFMFNDRRFEARNLAGHGFYNMDTDEFQPFQIDVWIPQGYEFQKSNPLWNHRKNVSKYEYTTIDEILEGMKPHHLTVIYDDCFTEEGKIKLWIDLMQQIAEAISPVKHYMFYHHELSSLIPEVPTKNIYRLTREAANTALNLRKDRIGMITTFHMPSEVFYRVSQKFGYVCFKKPVNRNNMIPPEEDAKRYSIQQVNISKGGYWMKHTIGMFPELPDKYRLVPRRNKWSYPKLQPIDESRTQFMEDYLHDPLNVEIMRLRAQGLSYQQIADRVELGKSAVYERAKKMNII